MSDDFENVSVEGTVENTPSAEPALVAVEPVVETPSEPVHADEQVFIPSADAPKDAQDANRDQEARERGYTHANGDVDGRTVTAVGLAAKQTAEDDKKSQFFEAQQQAENLRKEKENNFGMSSHDLTRLLDFISSPDLKKKLEERLTSSIGEKKAKKAMAELDEFNQLKKKQDSGQPLTDLEKARMAELRKSEDLKAAIQTAQEMQEAAHQMELKTNGATTKAMGQQLGATENRTEELKVTKQQSASFESSVSSGISATAITPAYNLAAVANTNDPKPQDAHVTLAANNISKKPAELAAGSGLMV